MNAKMYASICFLCEELCMKFGLVSYILTPCWWLRFRDLWLQRSFERPEGLIFSTPPKTNMTMEKQP